MKVSFAMLVASALVASCGAGSDVDGPNSDASNPAVSAEKLTELEQYIDNLTQRPSDVGITVPLTKKLAAGKRLVFIYPEIPASVPSLNDIKAAAATLGMDFLGIPQGSTQDDLKSAVSTAQQYKPDGVIISNIDPGSIQDALSRWKASGVPVVNWGSSMKNGDAQINWQTSKFVGSQSQKLVDWLMTYNKGKQFDLLYVSIPGIPGLADAGPMVKTRLEELCDTCKFHELLINATDIGTPNANNAIISYLQRNPDIKFGFPVIGDFAIGLPAALKTAGIKSFEFVTSSGGPANYRYIQDGEQLADLAYGSHGWVAVDAIARYLVGDSLQPQFDYEVQTQMITKDNQFFPVDGYWPGPANEADEWKRLWLLNP